MTGKSSRKTKPLSGAKAQAYLKALFSTETDLTPEGTRRLLDTCGREIAEVRIRLWATTRLAAGGKTRRPAAPTDAAPAPAGEARAFDPFAFSLVVVMTKEGRGGLAARLSAIPETEHLRALAKAQHVPVPETAATHADVVEAILSGTAQRIADRRAAAS